MDGMETPNNVLDAIYLYQIEKWLNVSSIEPSEF